MKSVFFGIVVAASISLLAGFVGFEMNPTSSDNYSTASVRL